jgi:hypothetical protein
MTIYLPTRNIKKIIQQVVVGSKATTSIGDAAAIKLIRISYTDIPNGKYQVK